MRIIAPITRKTWRCKISSNSWFRASSALGNVKLKSGRTCLHTLLQQKHAVPSVINLARNAGLEKATLSKILRSELDGFPPEIVATANLVQAVVHDRVDDPEARKVILDAWGEKGLIEISFAMSGAALLPNVKRAMGYATACDINLMKL